NSVHGEQGFIYHRPIYGGDTISGSQKIVDIFEKKGGALVFILTEIDLANQHGEPVCELTSTIVVRRG
ncbi:MAG: MaoC family dehydratase N-terminal domain-containing protein, partial [Hyphomicrobiales bacterium]|nr:MaoC family dehydratase N-terminal domain-containing protein [Hyphomicrobiales bacterium]